MAAVVGDIVYEVELRGPLLGDAVGEGGADGDIGLVVKLLAVGESDEYLLGATLHGTLTGGDILLKEFANVGLVLAVELLLTGLGESVGSEK